MKTTRWMALLSAGLLVVLLASCGPSYVGVRTAPNYGYGYGYGPGYYGARPYGYGYGPGFYRPPVIVQRRTYVVPRGRYYNNPSYAPNARSGRYNNGGVYRNNGSASSGRSRGPR